MNIKNLFQASNTSKIILTLVALLVLLLIFQAGMFVGYNKGSFTSRWDDRYFRGPNGQKDFRSPMFEMMQRGDGINPHGAFGEIISKDQSRLIVKGQNTAEEIININTDTIIRKHRDLASTSDLVIGGNVVIIGEPNANGEIDAKLIRIMPVSPEFASTTLPKANYYNWMMR